MVTGSRIRVVVELERAAATVSGQTCIGQSAPVEFYGWLELIDRLEGALGQPPGEGSGDTDGALPEARGEASV